MFKIYRNHSKDSGLSILEIKGNDDESHAKLNLENGGSLMELRLDNFMIIKDLSPLMYENTFASSILFPFASRIKNGEYMFLNALYKLPINEVEKQNALHGLVYNKTFKVIAQSTTNNKGQVTLEYKQEEIINGFPFKFSLQLIYVLTKDNLTLEIKVKNQDNQSFPFSIGWHPYFCSSDLYQSSVTLNSHKKIEFDENEIAVSEVENCNVGEIKIENKRFDDCFVLNDSKVQFKTPDFTLNIDSSSDENYLLVYTINEENVIAIEPLNAAPNCFNTKKGLKILEPNAEYGMTMKIDIITDNH